MTHFLPACGLAEENQLAWQYGKSIEKLYFILHEASQSGKAGWLIFPTRVDLLYHADLLHVIFPTWVRDGLENSAYTIATKQFQLINVEGQPGIDL